MRYCKSCLTTDLRPNALFNDSGICIACSYAAMPKDVGTSFKLEMLRKKINSAKKKSKNRNYDCIIGVSGGKDSTRQAHWVKTRLGLRPLLVCCCYPPKQMGHEGAKNLSNLTSFGFDILTLTPGPKTSARLSLESFTRFGNVCKSTEMALFSTVPRLAIDMGINIVLWGENPALQVGDSAVLGSDEFDGNNLRQLNTLKEGGYDWILDVTQGSHLSNHYFYPEEELFLENGINIFYLGAAWDDWSNAGNSYYGALHGLTLKPGQSEKTGDISNASALDEEFTNINMMIKYYKFGFGRATDIVCELIRDGVINRQTGIDLVKAYDGICSDEIIDRYCEYVGISESSFWCEVHKWLNKDLFTLSGTSKRPVPKFTVGIDYGN